MNTPGSQIFVIDCRNILLPGFLNVNGRALCEVIKVENNTFYLQTLGQNSVEFSLPFEHFELLSTSIEKIIKYYLENVETVDKAILPESILLFLEIEARN